MERTLRTSAIFRQIIAMLILTSILSSIAAAQGGHPAPAKPAAKPAAKTPKPKPGWSGIITFRKVLNDDLNSDEKLFGSIDERERIKHTNTRRYTYQGTIVVADLDGTGRPATRAEVSISDNETQKVHQTELTNCHSWEPSRLISSTGTDRKLTEGSGRGEAESFSLSVNGDRFDLSFGLPAFQARYQHTTATTYSGLCPDSTRKPSNSSDATDVSIASTGRSISGQIDPNQPDVIAGTKSWTDGSAQIKSFTYTVTWRLRRKPEPLMITDVRFEQPIYPKPNDWREIPDDLFAIDGNQVKVIATIANLSSTDKSASVSFKETKENVALANGPVNATIPANGQKDVELVWDTSGFAWRDSGAGASPEQRRNIEVQIPDDSMSKELTVLPKPVVAIWGIWQWASAMEKFHSYFEAVSDKWAVWDGMTDPRKPSADSADALDKTIRQLQRHMNAWHVDLVALQNGGLTARVYINSLMPTQFDGRPTATHLIMVGTPNLGTPCAAGVYGLSFKLNTLNWDAVAEMSPESMKRFNLLVNNTNGTKFASLAVNSHYAICQEEVPGDGFTPLASAIWRTKVNAVSKALVSSRDIMGEVSHFRQVYAWLAIPPKGDHAPDPSTLAVNESVQSVFRTASYSGYSPQYWIDDEKQPIFRVVALVKPNASAEVEIPVEAGSELSVVFIASADISATLLNERGETIGTDLSAGPAANDLFRTIRVTQPFSRGKMKLRLEGKATGDMEVPVIVYAGKGTRPANVAE